TTVLAAVLHDPDCVIAAEHHGILRLTRNRSSFPFSLDHLCVLQNIAPMHRDIRYAAVDDWFSGIRDLVYAYNLSLQNCRRRSLPVRRYISLLEPDKASFFEVSSYPIRKTCCILRNSMCADRRRTRSQEITGHAFLTDRTSRASCYVRINSCKS